MDSVLKSKYSNLLILLAVLASFVPVLTVDVLLDNYAAARERAVLQNAVNDVASRVQAAAYDGVASLRRILAESSSLCSTSFLANTHRRMEESLYVRQVLVEAADGLQFCDGLGKHVRVTGLSPTLPLPNSTETLTVTRLGSLEVPMLRISQVVAGRTVSVFVPVYAAEPQAMLSGLQPATAIAVTLSDGTAVLSAGGDIGMAGVPEKELVTAQAFAGELPIRVAGAVPFAMVRGGYADLDTAFTILSCLMCAAALVLALQHVRKSDLPAFDLERAISAGEIKPYYQPVINLRTGEVCGCEVMARWEKRNGEVVAPGAFIEFAEITGLALPMTLRMMQQVRTDLTELCREMPGLKVSINLFEQHFRDSTIVDDVQSIFGEDSIRYRQLVFEITERQPLDKLAEANAVIAGLHALGCRVALDDAGTGHSNLAYLQTLGIDIIKIDRIFVDMIKPGIQGVPVLDALLAMGRELMTEIVAEGVENEAQALYLRSRGVVQAQGYLFAPALQAKPFRDLTRALNGGASSPALAADAA